MSKGFFVLMVGVVLIAAPANGQVSETAGQDVEGDARIPLIQRMIEEKGLCWKAGHTSVSDLSDEEKQLLLGYVEPEPGTIPPDPNPILKDARDLPAAFDWRESLQVTMAKNQGGCGSCWLFGPVGATEAAALIYDDYPVNLSEQQVLSCASYGWGCGGGQSGTAYLYIRDHGLVDECCFPYEANDTVPCDVHGCEARTRVDSYVSVTNTISAIKNAIYTYGPVSTGIWAFDNWMYYQEGCYTNIPMGSSNHCILIVGWDDSQCDGAGAWLIKNSWGIDWGEWGFGWVEYETCGIGRSTIRVDYTAKMHVLNYVGYAADPAKSGNGNGFLEPGESGVTLQVTLMNDGQGPATGVTGVLHTDTPGVTITDNTADFADMASETAGSTVAPHFEIGIDGSFFAGDWIECDLYLTTDTYPDTISFPVYVGEFAEVLVDDFESDLGWTVGAVGDSATEGIWERAVSTEKWDPWLERVVQTRKDASPYPGTMCYVTENSPLGTLMRFGDVDGGRTTLSSPVVDLSGYDAATVSYERWYQNNIINEDGDPLTVDVSDDGGGTWENLETLTDTPADRRWHRMVFAVPTPLTDQMQFRVVAADYGSNSLVEAALDDFEILGFTDTSSDVEDGLVQNRPGRVFLGQNVPNPFNPETIIPYGLPGAARVDLSVYNIQGQRVRQLVDGMVPAGVHQASWNGRDENGQAVSSGIYFYRLKAGEYVETRRMTLIK